MDAADSTDLSTVEQRLRLGGGFHPDDRERVVGRLSQLEARLKAFRPDAVDLTISVKGRDKPDQRTVLECRIAGWPTMVGTSTKTDLSQAIAEVRQDLIRQLNSAKTRTEPRNSRKRRTVEKGEPA
jgi:ribosome-associated translation inhibitor RaiA